MGGRACRAVAGEDFDEAKRVKLEIEGLRLQRSEPFEHFEPTTLTVTEIGTAEELEEMIEAGNVM